MWLPVIQHQQHRYSRLASASSLHGTPIDRTPIVLLNGWGMAANAWDSLILVLQQEHDVIVMDVVYSEDADALCHTIHKELPARCVLIGWSLGGMLATKITAMYPESIVGLITLASNAQFVADRAWPHAMSVEIFEAFFQLLTTNPEKALQRFSRLVVQGDKQRREQQQYLSALEQTNSSKDGSLALTAGLVLLRDIKNQTALEHIRCPSLYCFGEKDALVPANAIGAIRLLNSQHQCLIIPCTSHLLHAPVDRIETPIMTFLTRVFDDQNESQGGRQ
jgi:pimeloyl-ACP methyl ester esterase